MDLAKLRSLVAIRETGSMSAAAASLGYTPGAVSQQMAALQRAAGTPLLQQVGRRMRLTDAGNVLAGYGDRMLELAGETQTALAALAEAPRGRVLVGVFGTAASALLPLAVLRLQREFPDVALSSVEVDVDEATSAVFDGHVDVAFGVDYPHAPIPRTANVELAILRSERFEIAVSEERATCEVPASLRAFANDQWILPPESTFYGLAFRQACRRLGFEPRVAHVVTDTASTLAMVAAGLGIAPVTGLMLRIRREGLVSVPLAEAVDRSMVLAYRTHPILQPATAAVVSAIRAAVDEEP